MKSSTKNAAKSVRDVAYHRQRYQNRVFERLVAWIAAEAQREQITKKELAERMGKDPALITRLLSHPTNLTLDTISDVLLAFDAEAEPPEIVRFKDRATPNYMHPLIARVTGTRVETRKDSHIKPIKPTTTENGSTNSVHVRLLGENAAA